MSPPVICLVAFVGIMEALSDVTEWLAHASLKELWDEINLTVCSLPAYLRHPVCLEVSNSWDKTTFSVTISETYIASI